MKERNNKCEVLIKVFLAIIYNFDRKNLDMTYVNKRGKMNKKLFK